MADDQIVSQPTLVGALIAAVVALATVVVHLWRDGRRQQRRIDGERKEMIASRAAWDVEREKLRALFEEKLREAVEGYASELHELHARHAEAMRAQHIDNRQNEAQIRAEFAQLMESISAESGKHADAIRSVLQKFLDRFVGPRGR